MCTCRLFVDSCYYGSPPSKTFHGGAGLLYPAAPLVTLVLDLPVRPCDWCNVERLRIANIHVGTYSLAFSLAFKGHVFDLLYRQR